MLKRLYIKNLALIEECELELNEGLNIITGETGAGKSLLLGSLGLLLGIKADKGIIRRGESEAYVEAVFELTDMQAAEIGNMTGISLDKGILIAARRLGTEKSSARINNHTVTNKLLSAAVGMLIDVCGQRDNLTLLNRDSHLRIIDGYGYAELKDSLLAVQAAFQEYKKWYLELSKYNMDESERAKRLDYAQFILNEIEAAQLSRGEDERLEADFKRMSNSVKICNDLSYIKESLSSNDFSTVIKQLNNVKDLDEELKELYSLGLDVEALLFDLSSRVSDYLDGMSFSEEEYAAVGERLDLINNLKFKHGRSIEDILDKAEALSAEIGELNDYQAGLDKVNAQLSVSKADLEEKCQVLSGIRREVADRLCRQIEEILMELQFDYASLEIRFQKTDGFTVNGFDKAGIWISLNKGEDLKPLETVASGGELSRIMLAVKSLQAQSFESRTLIFDEIDTGVGGKTALSIAHRLEALSGSGQVLCITHLPSIAAAADYHYKIYKKESEGRTNTYIDSLDDDERVRELAVMIAGDNSSIAMENAKELIFQLKGERK